MMNEQNEAKAVFKIETIKRGDEFKFLNGILGSELANDYFAYVWFFARQYTPDDFQNRWLINTLDHVNSLRASKISFYTYPERDKEIILSSWDKKTQIIVHTELFGICMSLLTLQLFHTRLHNLKKEQEAARLYFFYLTLKSYLLTCAEIEKVARILEFYVY